ncbi:MAG: helix-turn-helix domain-containing protein [Oscillospiraceae bacterium]|nr:helix-turn-helix domain-containing protein [Oscillospiraceae bacterium]MBR4100740.1 helix-turn-helix domain-containing protein [Oscillospiraceae bacterium]MBR6617650.1 helix-turn-helix domain-containing protein [Oscillospiraceae bacterium]
MMNVSEYSHNVQRERYSDVQRVDTGRIEQLLKSGSMDMCRRTVMAFFEETGFFQIDSMLMRLYVAMDLYILVRVYSKELGVPYEEFVERFGSIDDIETNFIDSEGAVNFFTEMLEQCIRWRAEFSRENRNETIRRTLKYIGESYMLEEVSLKSAAAAVNLSPTYLSALFKKEMEMNFSDYLAQVRIDKAKELLCRTSKLVSEISYEVGFSDYRYFGQIFKKYTGQTPREFRANSNRTA